MEIKVSGVPGQNLRVQKHRIVKKNSELSIKFWKNKTKSAKKVHLQWRSRVNERKNEELEIVWKINLKFRTGNQRLFHKNNRTCDWKALKWKKIWIKIRKEGHHKKLFRIERANYGGNNEEINKNRNK